MAKKDQLSNVLGIQKLREHYAQIPVLWVEYEERYSEFSIAINGRLTAEDQFPHTTRYGDSHFWPHFVIRGHGPKADERGAMRIANWDFYFEGGERIRVAGARYLTMVLEALRDRNVKVRQGKLFAEYALELMDVLELPLIYQPLTPEGTEIAPEPLVFTDRAAQFRFLLDIEVTYMAGASKLSAHEKAEICDMTRYELPKR